MGKARVKIDWDVVAELCKIQCTHQEIADFLKTTRETVDIVCKRDNKITFQEFYTKHRGDGKISLRRAQWQKAVDKQDTTMLIFLGKIQLGQKDKVENDVNMQGTQSISIDLSSMTKEQLREIMSEEDDE